MERLNKVLIALAFAVGALLSAALCWELWGGEQAAPVVPKPTAEVRTDKGLVAARQPAIGGSPIASVPNGAHARDTGRIKAVPKAEVGCPEVTIAYTVSEDKDGNRLLTFESDNADLEATHLQLDFGTPPARRYLNRLGVTTSYDPQLNEWRQGALYTRDFERWPVFVGGGVVDTAATLTIGMRW